jgi:hypothetical protein
MDGNSSEMSLFPREYASDEITRGAQFQEMFLHKY